MNRRTRLFTALIVASLIAAAAGMPIAAQDAGDQIVETAVTPPAEDSGTDDTQDTDDGQSTDTNDGSNADTTGESEHSEPADDVNSAESDTTDDTATDPDANIDADETRAATESAADDAETGSNDASGGGLIVVEDLNLREEADVEADIIQVMPAGSVVTLAGDGEAVNDFLPVNFGEDAGWAYLPFLVDEAQGDNLAVVTTTLNLRTGPSVSDDVITVMPEGAQVRVAGLATDDEGDDWNWVYYDETLAWALAEFVEFTDAPVDGATPVEEPGVAGVTETDLVAESTATGDLVTVVDANLRTGASIEDAVVSIVPFGTFASVTGAAANGFVPVTVAGVAGWLSTDVIAPAEIAASLTGTAPVADVAETTANGEAVSESGTPEDDEPRTALSDLNLRAGPGEDAEILLVVPTGDTLTLTYDGYENGYAAVSYQGTGGWVVADLLTP